MTIDRKTYIRPCLTCHVMEPLALVVEVSVRSANYYQDNEKWIPGEVEFEAYENNDDAWQPSSANDFGNYTNDGDPWTNLTP